MDESQPGSLHCDVGVRVWRALQVFAECCAVEPRGQNLLLLIIAPTRIQTKAYLRFFSLVAAAIVAVLSLSRLRAKPMALGSSVCR